MPDCHSCGTVIHHPMPNNCTNCVPCIPSHPPTPPACRGKTYKDGYRVKSCPPCECVCPRPPCVRKTKCKLPSFKDRYRMPGPCPEPVECSHVCPNGCECVGAMSH